MTVSDSDKAINAFLEVVFNQQLSGNAVDFARLDDLDIFELADKLKPNMFVCLHNFDKPETMGNLGYLLEIGDPNEAFRHKVFEFYDKTIYHHHSSTIKPLKLK